MNSKTVGFIIIFIGVLFLLDTLDVAEFGDIIRRFWPLILIFVGIKMLVSYKRRKEAPTSQAYPSSESFSITNPASPFPVPDKKLYSTRNEDSLNESEIFGDLSFEIISQNFRGGRISNVFGDVRLDLTKCTIADGDSVLDISAVFGGITLLVPREMSFTVQSNVSFGDIRIFDQKSDGMFKKLNYKTANFDSSPKRLHIVTSSVFGDCKVW